MIRISPARAAAVLVVAFAATLAPSAGLAQVSGELRGPFIGLGVGVGNVREPGLDQHRVGVMLHARAGWGFGRVAPMLELGVHGLPNEEPRHGDIVIIDPSGGGTQTQVVRRPRTLNTISVLAAVQVGLPGELYVRPAAGLAWQSFPVYDLGTDAPTLDVREEAGPAAQLAIGRTLRLSRRFPVAVEAIGLWSGGEDSTGARWAAGVQVVPMLRF